MTKSVDAAGVGNQCRLETPRPEKGTPELLLGKVV